MKIVFKAPIILSLLAASAFSIIGQEPARAGNKLISVYGSCKLVKITSGPQKGIKKVKKNSGTLIFETFSTKDGKFYMRNSDECKISGKQ